MRKYLLLISIFFINTDFLIGQSLKGYYIGQELTSVKIYKQLYDKYLSGTDSGFSEYIKYSKGMYKRIDDITVGGIKGNMYIYYNDDRIVYKIEFLGGVETHYSNKHIKSKNSFHDYEYTPSTHDLDQIVRLTSEHYNITYKYSNKKNYYNGNFSVRLHTVNTRNLFKFNNLLPKSNGLRLDSVSYIIFCIKDYDLEEVYNKYIKDVVKNYQNKIKEDNYIRNKNDF